MIFSKKGYSTTGKEESQLTQIRLKDKFLKNLNKHLGRIFKLWQAKTT